MAQFKQWFDQDLTENIVVRHCESVMFTGDDKGALVGVRLFDGGPAYSGGGTVSGAVKRSDGGLVALTGTLSGNAASVVIPAAALAVAGPIGVHIVLTQGGSTTTVLKAIYAVDDNSGAAVDPGTIIPSVNDLITAINTAVASIPSDYSALLHALAPDFSASTAYYAGDYVWYNGALYRFTANHAAGTWIGTDAVTTIIGNDLVDLRAAFAEYNCVDALAFLDGTNYTRDGITFQWNADGSCTVSGTATDWTFSNKYHNTNAMPAYIKPGSIVYFKADNAQSDKIYLEVFFYKDGSSLSYLKIRTDTAVTIPADAQGVTIRLRVDSGTTANTTVKYAALTTISNAELYAILKEQVIGKRLFYSSSDTLPSCDLNDVLNGAHILIDDNTYQHSPENSRTGYLFSYHINNIYLQIFYGFNTPSVWKRRYLQGTWSEWIKIGGETNNITNEYTFNSYENSYSVTASPSITTDTNAYLAPTGDTTDRTNDIITLLSTQGVCRLGKGDYYVTDLVMPAGTSIIGSGNATHIIRSGTDDGFAIKMGSRCCVKDCWITGSSTNITVTETLGNRHGILWQGTYTQDKNAPLRGMISNVHISSFTGGGITCYDTGYGINTCLMVDEAYITNCGAGINISYKSEFNKFTNVHSYANWYGCINNGGNNVFTACDFSGNKVGFLIDNASGQSPNNSHGSAVGCVFNHTDSNSGIGIKVVGCEHGYVFTGCQIFFSQIYLENSSGITVSDCNFGTSNCDITISGGAGILFANNMHGSAPTVTITDNNDVKFVNCYVRGTGQAIRAESTGLPIGGTAGQYLRKKSGSDYDAEWKTPNGGEINVSGTDTRKVDEALNGLENEIGVVVTGNKTASGVAASVGQYVILKNSSITGKTDGLYKAAKAIPAATAIDGTYLTAVSGGGLNSLDSAINSVEAKSLGNFFNSRSVSNPDFNNLTEPGVWFIGDMATATNGPGSIGWVTMLILVYGSTIVQVIFGGRQSAEAKTRIWVRYRYQNEWKPWYYTQMQAV